MNDELYYTPLDYVTIINKFYSNWSHRDKIEVANTILSKERMDGYICSRYCNDPKGFIMKFIDLLDYQYIGEDYRKEKYIIERDLEKLDIIKEYDMNIDELRSFNLFFKEMRIKIIYLDSKDFVRMKLTTFLSKFGYKKRSEKFRAYVKQCLDFYNIKVMKKGGLTCDITTEDLDVMVTFKVLS